MTTHEQLLSRFIGRIDRHQDTPSLIMTIAADKNLLRACRSIVDPGAPTICVPASTLERICSRYGWDPDDLIEMLIPAAKVLGIMPADRAAIDHYQVLGVSPESTPHEIRQAFRHRVFNVHPDTAPDQSGSDQRLQDLLEAYQTLRGPTRRSGYDTNRQRRWRENPARLFMADDGASVYRWYLGGLTIIFIILLFITIAINE